MKNLKRQNPAREQKKSAVQSRAARQKSSAKPSSLSGGALKLQNEKAALRAQKAHFGPQEIKKIDISAIIKPSGSRTEAKLPELLSPAGSIDALRAAIAGGADAVYFGGGGFNARINAKNFTNDEIRYATELLHSHGKKAYITLNTLVHGREIEDYLRFAEFVSLCGADALIVADMGGAEVIHRHLPDLELHASTQMSGHNLAEAQLLSEHGFSRMVCARELSKADIEYLVKNSPIEIEMFVHGALCVCHSGQCLFSSLVGGRSGNRGECAQPCRLPYKTNSGESYPLSLKDLSLAGRITELIDCGVHSLKIEGRMKSPEYVFGVVRAFRTLLDEGRNASAEELSMLAKIFSRGGFTDGYYKKNIGSSMLGVRSDEQKAASRTELFSSENIYEIKPPKQKIKGSAVFHTDEPSRLTLSLGKMTVSAEGVKPQKAINAPLCEDNVRKNLSKLGNTDFVLEDLHIEMDENIILPVSALNALRRDAVKLLEDAIANASEKSDSKSSKINSKSTAPVKYIPAEPKGTKKAQNTVRFFSAAQITERARKFFDVIFLPLQSYKGECEGVILPPVILDSERAKVEKMLKEAAENGAKYVLCGNLGAIELAKAHGLSVFGDFRFNVYNSETVAYLEGLGVESVILSPELTLPRLRDIKGDTAAVIYGRIPLMLLEKCVASEISDCRECQRGAVMLTDRMGVHFPVLREFEHRSVIYNSLPTYMADKQTELERSHITNRHFIFSTESPDECDRVIDAYEKGIQAKDKIRRI